MSFLELKAVSRYFGGLRAVDKVSLQVERGEIFGLIGPNGSGKTTIFNLINRYIPMSSGDILFKRKSIRGMRTYQICQLGIARTFQAVKPLKRMTVMENIMTSAFCRVKTMKQAQEMAIKTLGFCNLLHQKDKLTRSLPTGERKRLEIARALATDPELLLLDEIAAGLNDKEVDETLELIQKTHELGITVIIVEHIMKVIMSISNRVHAINYGQTIAQGTPEQVANNQSVINAYLGEPHAYGRQH